MTLTLLNKSIKFAACLLKFLPQNSRMLSVMESYRPKRLTITLLHVSCMLVSFVRISEQGVWCWWVVSCWHGYLSGARCRLACAQLMPLPLTVSCFSKIQIGFTFLVPAHPGSPGHRAVKRVCVCDVGDLPVQVLSFGFSNWVLHFLQCFDAVGWAAGRASGL